MTKEEKEKKIESQIKRFKRLTGWTKHLEGGMDIDTAFSLAIRLVNCGIKINTLASQKPYIKLSQGIDDGGITIAVNK